MESDESIHSEAVNTYGLVVAEEGNKNPCEHSEVGENVDLPHFDSHIYFFFCTELCYLC